MLALKMEHVWWMQWICIAFNTRAIQIGICEYQIRWIGTIYNIYHQIPIEILTMNFHLLSIPSYSHECQTNSLKLSRYSNIFNHCSVIPRETIEPNRMCLYHSHSHSSKVEKLNTKTYLIYSVEINIIFIHWSAWARAVFAMKLHFTSTQ